MEGEGGGADPLILLRRAEIKDAYARLLEEHPALPQEIRDFQVQLETWSLALNCSQAAARQSSHSEFCANWVGQNSPDAAGSTSHATW